MKCIEIEKPGGPEVLKIIERPKPVPGPREVLIEIKASGVNRPEVLQRQGLYPPPPGATDIPGLETAGVISAIGDGVQAAMKVGDKVCALLPGGSYAEFASVDERSCLPIPNGLSFEEAASLPETYFTVWANAFDDGALKEGETLLIHGGTSGIGVTAIALAKARGVRVIATAGTLEKCNATISLGADAAFNYGDDGWEAKISEMGGVDVVLDMTGGDFIARNMACMRPHGRHVSIAFLRGMMATIPVLPIMQKRLRLSGSTMKARTPEQKGQIADALRCEVWPLLEDGRLKPQIDTVFPLAEVADAHRHMEAGAHIGKIVLKIS